MRGLGDWGIELEMRYEINERHKTLKCARTNKLDCGITNEQGATDMPNQSHRIHNAHSQFQQFCIRLCYLTPFSTHNHGSPYTHSFLPSFLTHPPPFHPSIHTRALSTHLLKLLLRPQLVRMPALLLATYTHVSRTFPHFHTSGVKVRK